MNCQQSKSLLQLHADRELDALRSLEIEQHLRDCSACANALRNLQNLKKAIRHERHFFAAPGELRRRISTGLRAQTGETRHFWNRRGFAPALTGFATACVVILLTFAVVMPFNGHQQLAQEVVFSHIRSLQPGHALDVVSTDQHTVKPWFNGKLDFSPPVKDLAAENFPLVGGRLDYLAGHSAAALVFQRNKHVINLFIWPTSDTDASPVVSKPIQGYNLIHWSTGGMSFWAVSDLNEKELLDFANSFKGA